MFRAILIAMMMFALTAPAMAEEAAPAAKADAAAPAAKADAAKAAPAPMDMSKMGPMTRPVKKIKKLRKEIAKFLKAEDAAMKKHDLAASMALIDFPVTMITDDAKGQGSGDVSTAEAFEAMMKPFYDMPMPKKMKLSRKNAITLLSPSLAVVVSTWNWRMGKKKASWKNCSVLIKKDGKWKSKMMAEAGWGDMPSGPPAAE